MKGLLRSKLVMALAAFLMIVAAVVIPLASSITRSQAAVGDVLRSLTPSPSGNGRALAFDPHAGHLFYTNSGDPHIYVTDTSGTPIMTLSPRVSGGPLINYGALTLQPTPTGDVLWGGRYDGSGSVDKIDPSTGSVTPAFSFPLPAGDSCYNQPSGSIDGLAFDASDNTLWLGDDAARTLYHVRMDGSQIGSSFATPSGLCRSGIAVTDKFLWLGLLSGPDQPPYEIGQVSKTDPSTLLQNISMNTGGGPEGLALDHSTFSGKCVLWTSQFGSSTTIQARELPKGSCHDVPTYLPLPMPTLRSVGLLTFHTFDKDNKPVVRGCVATVVNSQNLSTIITAGHCVIGSSAFGGNSTATVTNLQFAPAHTGGCWPGNPLSTPQIDVDQCGGNPYGVWYADKRNVFVSPTFAGGDQPDDFAFIVLKLRGPQLPVQSVVGGFPITWDTSTNPGTDPLQQQTWRISSYAADDANFTIKYGFGPFECDWIGSTSYTFASPRLLGASLGNACSFVNPITGSERAFNFPTKPPCPSHAKPDDSCHAVPPFGASGSPWTNGQNTGNGTISIGAVLSSSFNNCNQHGACLETYQGTKLGDEAQAIFATAQEQVVR